MEFGFLGEKFSVGWSPVMLVIAASVVGGLLSSILLFTEAGVTAISEGIPFEQALLHRNVVSDFFGLFWAPFLAVLILALMGAFKMKKDANSFLSMAAASFAITLALSLLLAVLKVLLAAYPPDGALQVAAGLLLELAGGIIGGFISAFLVYLWLRILNKPEKKLLKKTAAYTAVLVAIMSVIWLAKEMFMLGGVSPDLTDLIRLVDAYKAVYLFVFSFPLIYSMPKNLNAAMYAFGGAYVCSQLIGLALSFIISQNIYMASGPFAGPLGFAMENALECAIRIIQLALIFFIAKAAKNN